MLDIEKLRKIGKIRRFHRDEYIFYEGDAGNEMFIILSGRVTVYINSIDGLPINICELGPADFFGEMSLLEGLNRSASVVASEDTTLLSIDEKNFQVFICELPSLSAKLMKGLSSRVRKLDNEMKTFISQSAVSNQMIQSKGDNIENQSTKEFGNDQTDNELYLPGHKKYNIRLAAGENISNFLFQESISCPVCEKRFDVQLLRMSKLKLLKVDFDSRFRYMDLEPLWYMILACPNCLYAAFHDEFHHFPQSACSTIRTGNAALKGKVILESSEITDIDRVFTHYYLALRAVQMIKPAPLKSAKLWLHLTWLYEDVQDKNMVPYAAAQAIDSYYNALFGPDADVMLQYEAQVNLILGELFMKKDDPKNALKHFRFTINSKGEETYKLQAHNRIKYLSYT